MLRAPPRDWPLPARYLLVPIFASFLAHASIVRRLAGAFLLLSKGASAHFNTKVARSLVVTALVPPYHCSTLVEKLHLTNFLLHGCWHQGHVLQVGGLLTRLLAKPLIAM